MEVCSIHEGDVVDRLGLWVSDEFDEFGYLFVLASPGFLEMFGFENQQAGWRVECRIGNLPLLAAAI
jgi:hypothetical protein